MKVNKAETPEIIGPNPHTDAPASWLQERASASPILLQRSKKRGRRTNAAQTPPLALSLSALQQWFMTVISHPRALTTGIRQAQAPLLRPASARTNTLTSELERIITRSPFGSELEGLHIYHYAYRARLIECLRDDFPSLVYALGEKKFVQLAQRVINNHPSHSPDLNNFGHHLVQYVAKRNAQCAHRAFIAELAQLEWAMVEVLHAQAAPVLSADALQKIPPQQWENLVFTPSATAVLLTTEYPVNIFLQHYRDDKQPPIPPRKRSTTVIYRQGYSVWRMDLTRPMAAILSALFAGKSLGQALETLNYTTAKPDREAQANHVMTWFSTWVQGGIFLSG
jgi:hypothetical protein